MNGLMRWLQNLLFLRHPDIQSDVWATPAEAHAVSAHDDDLRRLRAEISCSPFRSVVVYCSNLHDYPGWVRTVEICEDDRVKLSFEPYGFDEGGIYFVGKYSSLSSAVNAVEDYLGMDSLNWTDQRDKYPPKAFNVIDCAEAFSRLVSAARSNSISLPFGATFVRSGICDIYTIQNDSSDLP